MSGSRFECRDSSPRLLRSPEGDRGCRSAQAADARAGSPLTHRRATGPPGLEPDSRDRHWKRSSKSADSAVRSAGDGAKRLLVVARLSGARPALGSHSIEPISSPLPENTMPCEDTYMPELYAGSGAGQSEDVSLQHRLQMFWSSRALPRGPELQADQFRTRYLRSGPKTPALDWHGCASWDPGQMEMLHPTIRRCAVNSDGPVPAGHRPGDLRSLRPSQLGPVAIQRAR